MENKHKIYIIVIITLILTFAFIFVMFKMILENGECIDRPFEYAAMRLKESGGNYYCSCGSLDPKLLGFYFNEDGIEIIEEEVVDPYDFKIN